MKLNPIPDQLLVKAVSKVEEACGRSLPLYERGIRIDEELIRATLEILNEESAKTLPQNCRNAVLEKTPDGLDARLKLRLGNLRRANIISDVLAKAGIVFVIHVPNPATGNSVKGTQLSSEWTW